MQMADVIILGGGAAGLTLAAILAPEARVLLLEAEAQPGVHASGRSAAVFVPSYGHGHLRDLTRRSRPAFDTPDPQWFPTPLLTTRGILRLVFPGGEAQHDEVVRDLPGIEEIEADAAARLFPLIPPERLAKASYEADAYDIDAEALMRGSMRAAKASGAEVIFNARATEILRKDGIWQVATRDARFAAPVLVNATGAWANEIGQMAGLAALPLTPHRRSMAVLPLPGQLTNRRSPFVVTSPLRWFAKTEAGQLLVSPADEDVATPHDAYADDMVIAEGLYRFSADTGFEVTRVDSSWAGLRTITPDEYPVVGFDPRAEGFFWLAGQAGFGIQCAPGLARMAADLLAQRPHPLAQPFRAGRFLDE